MSATKEHFHDEIEHGQRDSIIEQLHGRLLRQSQNTNIHVIDLTMDKQLMLDGFGEPTKSVIITGKQGSGKTTKMNQLLSLVDEKKRTQMGYREMKMFLQSGMACKNDVFACDEITSPKQIEYLSNAVDQYGIVVIIATQLSYKELEIVDISKFQLIEL